MTPELMLWLFQWIATMVGPWAVPRLAVVVNEWPLHFLCSGWLGLLAWRLSFCIFPRYSGTRWTHALLYALWRGSVLVCASVLVHWWADASGQTIIPAGVR